VTAPPRRALGVDLGSRRIGLAATDPSGVLASPVGTVVRHADRADDHAAILAAAREADAAVIVVGLPRSLSGDLGPAAQSVLAEVEELTARARAAGIEVETYDERFTSTIAQQGIREAEVRRGRRRSRRAEVDAAAAAVILQSWLEARA